mgnify:CR=1 FL=1
MTIDFWFGFSAGLAFLFLCTLCAIVLSKRMSAEQRKAYADTIRLLEVANDNRNRIAIAIEQRGRRK